MSQIRRLGVMIGVLVSLIVVKPSAGSAHDALYNGLFGGAVGAGIGYGFGGPRGAAIGGGVGLAVGFLSTHFYTAHHYRYRDDDTAYDVPYGYQPGPYLPPPPPGAYTPQPIAPMVGYPVYQQPWGMPYYESPFPPPAPENRSHFDRRYCREFTSTITVEGRKVPAHGVACRQADGVWRVISDMGEE
ncbi:MAG: hypothetical protein R3E60_00055 [Alphaproteobacteria bacterium]